MQRINVRLLRYNLPVFVFSNILICFEYFPESSDDATEHNDVKNKTKKIAIHMSYWPKQKILMIKNCII